MILTYYCARPAMKYSEWNKILEKNKKAFEAMATWKIQHPG